MSFKTDDVNIARHKLRQLNIINAAKYFMVSVTGRLAAYFCIDCRKRSYVDYPITNPDDIVCNHCNHDKNLFCVGFKQSEKQTKVKYAV